MGLIIDGKPKTSDVLYNPPYPDWLFEMSEYNGCRRKISFTEYKKEKTVEYVLLDPDKDWTAKVREEIPVASNYSGGQLNIDVDLGTLVRLATEQGMTAFFIGRYGWGCRDLQHALYFIFPKNVPEEFRMPVLMHEIEESNLVGIGESNILDMAANMAEHGEDSEYINQFIEEEMEFSGKFPHVQACHLEIDLILAQGQNYAEQYTEWILKTNGDLEDSETWFNQAVPGFLAKQNRLNQHILTTLLEFYLILENVFPISYDKKKYIGNLSSEIVWISKFLPGKAPEESIR